MTIHEAVLQLHNIARDIYNEAPNESFQIRRLADSLSGSIREKKEREERVRHTHSNPNKSNFVTDCIGGDDND